MKSIVIGLLVSVLFISCSEDAPTNKDQLKGTWLLEKEVYTAGTMTETFTYDNNDLTNTSIFEFESNVVTVYDNAFCSADYTTEIQSADITNTTITIPGDGIDLDYEISGNTLTLSGTLTVDTETFTYQATLTAYDGDIPPAEWSTLGDTYEPDSSRSLATAITVDGGSQDHILCGGESDWFSFSALAGTVYILETTNPNFLDTYIELYDENGTFLDYDDDNGTDVNARLTWTCNATGTYYFNVHGYGYDMYETGPYSVSVTTPSGRHLSPATGSQGKEIKAWLRSIRIR